MRTYLLLLLLFPLFLCGCGDKNIVGDGEKILFDKNRFEVPAEGGELEVKVSNKFLIYDYVSRTTSTDVVELSRKENDQLYGGKDEVIFENLTFYHEGNKIKLKFTPNNLTIDKIFYISLYHTNSYAGITITQKGDAENE